MTDYRKCFYEAMCELWPEVDDGVFWMEWFHPEWDPRPITARGYMVSSERTVQDVSQGDRFGVRHHGLPGMGWDAGRGAFTPNEAAWAVYTDPWVGWAVVDELRCARATAGAFLSKLEA